MVVLESNEVLSITTHKFQNNAVKALNSLEILKVRIGSFVSYIIPREAIQEKSMLFEDTPAYCAIRWWVSTIQVVLFNDQNRHQNIKNLNLFPHL